MADIGGIKLSPALSRMIRRDNDRDYYLRWVDGFFRTYVNKEDAIAKIRERFNLMIKDAYRKCENDTQRQETIVFAGQVRELVNDLRNLSHADFDILTQIQVYDVFAHPINKINKQTIILTKEA
jgi:hypothetical protein